MAFRGAGAAEYLGMLALAMTVGLGAVSLLNNAQSGGDSAQTENLLYWKTATPISIVESNAVGVQSRSDSYTYVYLRIKNNGVDPVRITKLLSGNNWIDQFACYDAGCSDGGVRNIRDYYLLQPGEEAFFDGSASAGTEDSRVIGIYGGTSAGGVVLGGATSLCGNERGKRGTLVIPEFGFEYANADGTVTREQTGRLSISCMEPC